MCNWTADQLQEHYRSLGLLTCGHHATADGVCGIPWCDAYEKPLSQAEQPDVNWPEWMIEADVTKLLEGDGWRSLRTDPVSDRGRGKGFGEKGMADHLYFRWPEDAPAFDPERDRWLWAAPCQVMWIEFKKLGEKAKDHQTKWHTIERARGALTLIAGVDFPASVAGFVEYYRKSGLNRGKV